jgi:hypothetical protein
MSPFRFLCSKPARCFPCASSHFSEPFTIISLPCPGAQGEPHRPFTVLWTPAFEPREKSGLAHDVVLLIWLNRTAATVRPPTLVCRPSSRALRLQVPLPTIRARSPLDLYVLIVVECAALLVSPPRSNRRLAHACPHAQGGGRFCLWPAIPS